MGLKVSVREAAQLTQRTERAVRHWIATEKLPALPTGVREQRPGVGPSQWEIDVDDLARVRGVTLNRGYLAELELREAELGTVTRLVTRVEKLEDALAEVHQQIAQLRREIEQVRSERSESK